jgi:flagellar hook-basal body complex protein FliE
MSRGIEINRLMVDMRAMQIDALAKPRSRAIVHELNDSSFSEMLAQAPNKVSDDQQASGRLANAV